MTDQHRALFEEHVRANAERRRRITEAARLTAAKARMAS